MDQFQTETQTKENNSKVESKEFNTVASPTSVLSPKSTSRTNATNRYKHVNFDETNQLVKKPVKKVKEISLKPTATTNKGQRSDRRIPRYSSRDNKLPDSGRNKHSGALNNQTSS